MQDTVIVDRRLCAHIEPTDGNPSFRYPVYVILNMFTQPRLMLYYSTGDSIATPEALDQLRLKDDRDDPACPTTILDLNRAYSTRRNVLCC